MASQNPIAGGPDFVVVLRNALEKTPGTYSSPPPTGGTQISVRFADDRLGILDAVCEQSGWNRNQLINAFVDRGLFELFHYLSNEAVEGIIERAAERVIPTYNPSAAVLRDLASYARFRLFPPPQRIRKDQSPEQLDSLWMIGHVDGDKGTVTFTEATQAGYGLPPLHTTHIAKVQPDTAQDHKNGLKNAMIVLNVQVTLTPKGPELLPLPSTSAVLLRQRK